MPGYFGTAYQLNATRRNAEVRRAVYPTRYRLDGRLSYPPRDPRANSRRSSRTPTGPSSCDKLHFASWASPPGVTAANGAIDPAEVLSSTSTGREPGRGRILRVITAAVSSTSWSTSWVSITPGPSPGWPAVCHPSLATAPSTVLGRPRTPRTSSTWCGLCGRPRFRFQPATTIRPAGGSSGASSGGPSCPYPQPSAGWMPRDGTLGQ